MSSLALLTVPNGLDSLLNWKTAKSPMFSHFSSNDLSVCGAHGAGLQRTVFSTRNRAQNYANTVVFLRVCVIYVICDAE